MGKRGLFFTHLFSADDSLLFFRNDKYSLRNLQNTLDWCCNISGQKINLGKSTLFCSLNMPKETQEAIARNLQVNLAQCPNKYLGINFKLRGNRIADFQFLIDKLNFKHGEKIVGNSLLPQHFFLKKIMDIPTTIHFFFFFNFKKPLLFLFLWATF